jgi:hypothetical protein
MSYQFGHVERDERLDLAADEPLAEQARRGGLPTPLLTALVMAIFAGGLWFAYVEGTHHAPSAAPAAPAASPGAALPATTASVPLIRADPQPLKVKPDRPGGMPVPDRDKLIYSERPGGPPVERLLPPPEQPQPRPLPAPAAAAPRVAELPPPGTSQATPLPLPATGPAPLDAGPGRPLPVRAPSAVRPAPEPTPLGGGHIRIQLGSLRSPDQARAEWQRLKRDYPDLLGRLTADAVRADLGERGIYYRILAGSFAQIGPARRLCSELKQRRVECSIVR